MHRTLVLATMAVAAHALRSGSGDLSAALPPQAALNDINVRTRAMHHRPALHRLPCATPWPEQGLRCARTRMQAPGQSVQWRDALGGADCRRVCGARIGAPPGEERLPVAGGPPAHYLCAQRGVYGACACA
jgi:hypothetical protein